MRHLPLAEAHSTEPLCVTRVPIFQRLEPEQQQVVASFARPVRLEQGEPLYAAGDRMGQLFVVHTGQVKIVRTSPSGREHVLRIAGPGDVVGEHSFLTGSRADHGAEAQTDAQLCVFAHPDLARLVDTYPGIAVAMLRSLSDRLTDAERRVTLATTDVGTRVADYLLALPFSPVVQDASGRGGEHGADPVVALPMTKKDIASYLGTTPESLSRALAGLQRKGLVQLDGEQVRIIDIEGLEAASSR